MKNKPTLCALIFLTILITACDLMHDSPEKIFDTIGLNGNKIPHGFHRHFKEMRQHKANGSLRILAEDNKTMKQATCEEYIAFAYKRTFEPDIENIKNLKGTDEAKPIIAAGLAMFEFADKIYKNNFPPIAKMIDEGKTDAEVDAAIDQLESTKGEELETKYKETMNLLIPYAKEHGVKYETIEMP
jgi:hypothetical protein